jgi:hypothetical protein
MARDQNGRIYSAYGRYDHPYEIYLIDPVTATPALQCTTSLSGITGLAFDELDRLYALSERTPGTSSEFDLYQVDLATGQTTLIGDTQLTNCGTLTYGGGSLWTFDGFTHGLVRIDPATAVATDVNPGFLGPADWDSLVMTPEGVLYQLNSGLWVQDVQTGVPSLVAEAPYFGIFGGAEYLPGPAPPFALGTLGQTGGPMGAQAWGATPGGDVVLLAALGPAGVAQIPAGRPCAGATLDLNATYRAAAVLRADAQGHALAGPFRAPAAVAGSLRLQALDLTTCTTSNLARVIY